MVIFFKEIELGNIKKHKAIYFLSIYKILNLISFSGFALIIVILITGIFSFIQVHSYSQFDQTEFHSNLEGQGLGSSTKFVPVRPY